MRSVPLTLGAAVLVTAAAMALATGPALADHRHSGTATVRVGPLTIAPGTEVEVRAFGCPSKVATASSPVFVSDAELTPDGDGLFSEATIRSTARAGAHRVTVDCGGTKDGDEGKVSVAVESPPSPVAPVHAGGGGAVPADERMRDNFGGAEAYGLVLSGGTALVVAGLAVQRRRRRHASGPASG